MANFYQLLGIDETASSTQLRAAYKRMAMQYHPDRNAGDKEAEEMFKLINEAYHVLTDPVKKARYDARLNSVLSGNVAESQKERRRRQYNAWRRSQQPYYRIDKYYFKIQGLAFLVFIIVAGFCFGIIHTINYFIEREHQRHWRENGNLLKQAHALFLNGHFNEAFSVIDDVRKEDPLDFRFGYAHDSLVNELRKRGDEYYNASNFEGAVYYFEVLRDHELPVRLETLQKIATCQYYLGRYQESILALKHLHNQQPWNLQLIYQIGLINLEKLDNKKEALHYFTLGKKLFKKNLSAVYGEAFEVVMNPDDVPEIYYNIFVGRARTNLAMKQYNEALKDSNWVVYLRRLRSESYLLRVEVKKSGGIHGELCDDIMTAQKLGGDISALKAFCR